MKKLKVLEIHRCRNLQDLSALPDIAPNLQKLLTTSSSKIYATTGVLDHPRRSVVGDGRLEGRAVPHGLLGRQHQLVLLAREAGLQHPRRRGFSHLPGAARVGRRPDLRARERGVDGVDRAVLGRPDHHDLHAGHDGTGRICSVGR